MKMLFQRLETRCSEDRTKMQTNIEEIAKIRRLTTTFKGEAKQMLFDYN